MNIFDIVNNINVKLNDFFTALRNHDHPDLSLVNHTHPEFNDLNDLMNNADSQSSDPVDLSDFSTNTNEYTMNLSENKCFTFVMDDDITLKWEVNQDDNKLHEVFLFIDQDPTTPYTITLDGDWLDIEGSLGDFNTGNGYRYLFKITCFNNDTAYLDITQLNTI